jgi:hypothetical protein
MGDMGAIFTRPDLSQTSVPWLRRARDARRYQQR